MLMNAASKDFHSKWFLNVLTKGHIQRPLSPPPSPPGPPNAHSTLMPLITGRRFPEATITAAEDEALELIPLRDLEPQIVASAEANLPPPPIPEIIIDEAEPVAAISEPPRSVSFSSLPPRRRETHL
jgi:hypothetical protein